MQLNTTALNVWQNSSTLTEGGGGGEEEEEADDSDQDVARYIWIIGGAILLVIGTFGNVLAFLVLCRPKMRRQKAALYLLVVAITDLAVLYTGLLRQVILITCHVDLREYSEAGCRIHMTLVYFFLQYSAWVLALLSIERLVSVRWPMVIYRRCTRFASAIAMVIVGVILFALDSHFFFTFGDVTETWNNQSITSRCGPCSEQIYYFFSKVWPWIDMMAFALLPLFIHIVCNTLIVRGVSTSFRESRRNRSPVTLPSDRDTRPPSLRDGQRLNGIPTPSEDCCRQSRKLSTSVRNGDSVREVECSGGSPACDVERSEASRFSEYGESGKDTRLKESGQGQGQGLGGIGTGDTATMNGASAKPFSRVPPPLLHSESPVTGQLSDQLCSCLAKNGESDDSESRVSPAVCVGNGCERSAKSYPASATRNEKPPASMMTCTNNEDTLSHATKLSESAMCDEPMPCAQNAEISERKGQTGFVKDDAKQAEVTKNETQAQFAKNSEQTQPTANSRKRKEQTEDNEDREIATEKNKDTEHNTNDPNSCAHQQTQGNATSVQKSRPKSVTFQLAQSTLASIQEETLPSEFRWMDLHQQHCPNNNHDNNLAVSLANNDDDHDDENNNSNSSSSSRHRSRNSNSSNNNSSSGSNNNNSSSNNNNNQIHELQRSRRMTTDEASSSDSRHLQRRPQAVRGRAAEALYGRTERGGEEEGRVVMGMRRTLVGVSVVFCVTTLPISLFLIIRWIQENDPPPAIYAALNILMYANNAVNFILYCMTSARFRAEMAAMGREWLHKCRSPQRHRPTTNTSPSPRRWGSSNVRWNLQSLSSSRSSRSYSFTTSSSLSSSVMSLGSLSSSVRSITPLESFAR